MVEFLNTSKAYAEIEDIVSKARFKLVLISPFIQMPERLLERLKDAGEKQNINITLICRKRNLKPEEREELQRVSNMELRFLEHLHAKCFYNEQSMVITSLNLYEYSQQHNREMGILLTAEEDDALFNEALSEAEFIVRTSTPEVQSRKSNSQTKVAVQIAHKQETNPTATNVLTADVGDVLKEAFPTFTKMFASSDAHKQGHCLRCGKSIPYDLDKPYCFKCFKIWAEWQNPDHKESFCHTCGKPAPSTKIKPLCLSCYRKTAR